MKRSAFLLALLFGLALTATAQREKDFTLRFMEMHGENYELKCQTISPEMMERIFASNTIEEGTQEHLILSQIKSIRVLMGGSESEEAQTLFNEAQQLAKRNKRRYTVYSQKKDTGIYTRHHDDQLVEIVIIRLLEDQGFIMYDLTGNMSDDIIQQIIQS